jgi:DNA-binding protein HU-beta
MNKAQLVSAIATKSGFTKKVSEEALNAIIGSIEEALESGEKVSLVGFGTFEVRDRAARTGRNPQTQEIIEIPAKKAPAFRAGKVLKDLVKG